MTIPVWVVSGFLGAGKTTLIQRLLAEGLSGKRVAVIENDFGDIRVDEALLADSGVTVSAIRDGCICCTLTGDFVKALLRLADEQKPEAILIEPSGVGMLSDVTAALNDPRLKNRVRRAGSVTVVDARRFERHWDNFGVFFEDQIAHADRIVFTHGDASERARQAAQAVRSVNPRAHLHTEPWEELRAQTLLGEREEPVKTSPCCACGCHGEHHHEHGDHDHEHDHGHGHGHVHTHAHAHAHDHGDGCGCGENHDHDGDCDGKHRPTADDVFDRLSLPTPGRWEAQALSEAVSRALVTRGNVLRIKGIVEGDKGAWLVQAVPNEVRVEPFHGEPTGLVVIGTSLDRENLTRLLTASVRA